MDPQESSPAPQFESINSSALSLLYGPTLTSRHDYWEYIALTRWTYVGKVMSLLFNMLFRFVIAFLMAQLSYLYMPTGKTIALTIGPFVGKVWSLLFNILPSRFVIAFLPRSNHLNSMAAVTICSDFGFTDEYCQAF